MTDTAYQELRAAALRRCFSHMNPPQLEAVTTVNGPVLVLAGAGSGKTTVIINRIANMVLFGDPEREMGFPPSGHDLEVLADYAESGGLSAEELRDLIAGYPIQPWQILAITFTNKAAGELKSRLAETLGEAAQDIHAATFHSACVRILRSCIDRLGFASGFTIYDSDDSLRAMKAVMKELDVDEKHFAPKGVLNSISAAKDRMISPEEYASEVGYDYRKSVIAKLYAAYQERLKAANALDFDDLIYCTVRIFEENPDVLEKYQRRYRYILVDEYQDTNYAQYRLVSLLSEAHGNLCVVGDDDQSIYRFRGATIENILQFEEQFPGCKTIRLEENYRSTGHILEAANGVIRNNEGRKSKHLWTDAGDGDKVTLVKEPDEQAECAFIARHIREAARKGVPYTDFAVLYRMNALSNAVERTFIREKIPYRIFGGVRFLDRKEIKDVLAYLCVLQNPHDLVRFERIVNVPKRGIGAATVATLLRMSQELGLSPLELVKNCTDFPVLAKRSAPLLRFSALMEELTAAAEALPMEELFDLLLEKTGYITMLEAEGDTGVTRIENVRELRSNIVHYCKENEAPTLEGFLEETALYSSADITPDEPVVSLMTMHAAKGLEFDTVFAVGMENGIFPSMRSFDTAADMEEERRLAYVTITRAKRHLYLMQSGVRMLFGSTKSNPVSRFVKEIPEEHLEIVDKTQKSAKKADTPAAASASGLRSQMQAIQRQKAKPAGTLQDYAPGERILDKGFGEGTILNATPMGGDCLLEVAFDKVGTKKLMAKYRTITKI